MRTAIPAVFTLRQRLEALVRLLEEGGAIGGGLWRRVEALVRGLEEEEAAAVLLEETFWMPPQREAGEMWGHLGESG